MSTHATTLKRRELQFTTLDEVRDEVERLAAADSLTLLGKWSFPQIVQHLANALNLALDGTAFRPPWYIRIMARMMRRGMLHKKMTAGFKLPEKVEKILVADSDVALEDAMRNFHQALERFQTDDTRAPHLAFGKLTNEEWELLHIRHGELHLSFVLPGQ